MSLGETIAQEHELPATIADHIAARAAESVERLAGKWKLSGKEREAVMAIFVDGFGLGRRTIVYGKN